MALLFFSDTNVLVDFAVGEELPLLASVLAGRGRWCRSVQAECLDLAVRLPLPGLRDDLGFLGEAHLPTPVEMQLLLRIRDDLAGPLDGPRAHLGEAESIAIIAQRMWDSRPVFVTADTEARAKARTYEIDTIETWDLVGLAIRLGAVTEDRVWEFRDRLAAHRRLRGAFRSGSFSAQWLSEQVARKQ